MDFLTIHSGRTSTIGGMQRLSGLDAGFLYLEAAKQPGGCTFDRLKDDLADSPCSTS